MEKIAERYGGTPAEAVTPEKTPQEPKEPENKVEPKEPVEKPEATVTEPVKEEPKEPEAPKAESKEEPKNPELPVVPSEEEMQGFEAIKTETTPAPEPEKAPEVPQEIQTKADAYDTLMGDKRVKSYVDYLELGGNIENFAREIGIIDYTNLSDEQIVRQQLVDEKMSADNIEEEMERFGDKSFFEKRDYADRVRASVEKRNESALNNFNGVSAERMESIRIQKQQEEQMHTQGATDLKNYLDNLEGKKVYNLQITPEVRRAIEEFAKRNTIKAFDAQGRVTGFDIGTTVQAATWATHGKEMMSAYGNAKYDMGRTAELEKRHRPNDKTSPPNNAPIPQKDTFENARKGMVAQNGRKSLFQRVKA